MKFVCLNEKSRIRNSSNYKRKKNEDSKSTDIHKGGIIHRRDNAFITQGKIEITKDSILGLEEKHLLQTKSFNQSTNFPASETGSCLTDQLWSQEGSITRAWLEKHDSWATEKEPWFVTTL